MTREIEEGNNEKDKMERLIERSMENVKSDGVSKRKDR